MVLVTTGLIETLPEDKNKPVLFLGEWCKLYKHKNIYQHYTHTTLPYHWDDRKKLYEDTFYIDKIYERYLTQLQQQLNTIHNVDFSVGYWRIIIGPWLRYFIEILYDRYLSIEASSKMDIDYTVIMECEEGCLTPVDMTEFISLFVDDLWNHHIYSTIISFFKIKCAHIGNIPKRKKKKEKVSFKERIKNILFYFNQFNTIHFFASYIKLNYLFQLQAKLTQIPTLGHTININMNFTYNTALRDSLVLPQVNSLFEEILNTLIKKQLPMVYIEGYEKFRAKVLGRYPKRAKIIFTANAHSSDEPFKFGTAEKKEYGAKYIISQHGGHMGTGLFASYEEHQVKSANRFFTWGWVTPKNDAIIPTPTKQLHRIISPRKSGDIILPLFGIPRYSYHLYSAPIASQYTQYLSNQLDLYKLLPIEVLKLIKLRLYSSDYQWSVEQRIRDIGYDYLIDTPSNLQKLFYTRLAECRLCIATYNATTFLETFVANYPTLLYWDPQYWELRDEAQPYFDLLHEAGILHYTPESLSAKLIEIYEDPLSWWSQQNIQTAKDRFCDQFANTYGDLKNSILKELSS